MMALVSVCFCIFCGIRLYKSHRDLAALKQNQQTVFQADLTTEGTITTPLRFSSSLREHGCFLFIKSSSRTTRPAMADALKDTCIDINIHNNGKILYEIRNAVITATKYPRRFLDEQTKDYIPFTYLPFKSIYPQNECILELTIRVPATSPELKECSFIVRQGWCILEHISYILLWILFPFSLVLAFLLNRLAFNIFLSRRKRKHNPSDNGIMYLLSSYPRWSETFLRLDLKGLEERGLPITIVSLFPGDCPPQSEWPKAHLLSEAAPQLDTSSFFQKIQSFLLFLIPKKLRATLSIFKHRRLLAKLLVECRKNHIGHIHAEFADLAALLGSEVSRLTGCTYSVGIHALDVHKMKYPCHQLFANVSFITSCNLAAAKALYRKCPWLNQKMHLIHHGVDLDLWKYMQDFKLPENIHVLFAGRLVPKKGLPILFQAIASLIHGSLTRIKLTIVGEGPMEQELKELADTLQIHDSIIWKGRVQQSEIPGLFQTATCICVPSIVTHDGDQDGIPNVITEAMASGLPVVASQVGGISEVVTEKTGWPVPSLTPVNLAAAIIACTSHPDETERRRNNARKLMEYNFDAKKLAEKRAYLLANVKTSDELFVK